MKVAEVVRKFLPWKFETLLNFRVYLGVAGTLKIFLPIVKIFQDPSGHYPQMIYTDEFPTFTTFFYLYRL